MGKVVRLSESDIVRLVKRIINEDIKIDKDERIKLTNNEKFLLVIPLTERSSCKYGATTKWCVSSKERNVFQKYKDGCRTVGMVMIKDPNVQSLLDTSKFAINVWGNNLEIHNDLDRYIMKLHKISSENGFENELRDVFRDFIIYHNGICDNKISYDYFDKRVD
jgi:hypothetical protein